MIIPHFSAKDKFVHVEAVTDMERLELGGTWRLWPSHNIRLLYSYVAPPGHSRVAIQIPIEHWRIFESDIRKPTPSWDESYQLPQWREWEKQHLKGRIIRQSVGSALLWVAIVFSSMVMVWITWRFLNG